MIVVNYFRGDNYDPDTKDGYDLDLVAVVNDTLDLVFDPIRIKECIDNDDEFDPEFGILYEVYLDRATIDSSPVPDLAFAINRVVKKWYREDIGWYTPVVRM